MIAILTHDPVGAVRQLRFEGTLEVYDPATRKGVFFSGRSFLIVTDPDQLKGLHVQDYRKMGMVSEELVEAARNRMER